MRLPDELAVLPLFNTVVYPQTVVPLAVSQPESISLIDQALVDGRPIALLALKAEDERPLAVPPEALYRVGTAALVHKLLRLPDGTLRIALQGLERVEVTELRGEHPTYIASIRAYPDIVDRHPEALMRQVIDLVDIMAPLIPQFPADILEEIRTEHDPGRLSYLVASSLQARLVERQSLLELPSAVERLEHLSELLRRTIHILELGRQLRSSER
ncbi:MAG: hypothetical protein KatS3mg057_1338 [Herpetosiphonaceae bacterium]|nr:MAG: hypothetical protein KatS3mg057_1338 [Herpetosiphonaceae bacterium]